MILQELLQIAEGAKASTFTINKNCSVDLSGISPELAKQLLDKPSIIGKFTFADESEGFVWKSTSNLVDAHATFGKAAAEACKAYKKQKDTSFCRLDLTHAVIK